MPSSLQQQQQQQQQKSSQSARPRLVEEGEPIYGDGDDDHRQHTNTTRSSLATSAAAASTTTIKTNTFYSVGGSTYAPRHDHGDHEMTGTSSPRQLSSPPSSSAAADVVASKPGVVVSSLQRAALQSNIRIKEDKTKFTAATNNDSTSLESNYHQTPATSIPLSRPPATSTSYVIGGGDSRSYHQHRPQHHADHQVYHQHQHHHHLHNADINNSSNNFRDAGHQTTIMPTGHHLQQQQQQQQHYNNSFAVAGSDATQAHTQSHSNAQAHLPHAPQARQFTITSAIPSATATQHHHNKDDDEDDMMMMTTDLDGDINHYHQHQSGHHQDHHHQYHNQHHRVTQRSYEIGNSQFTGSNHHQQQQQQYSPYPTTIHADPAAGVRAERMEGVEDHSEKSEIVVLDGANVAYAYAEVYSTNHLPSTAVAGASAGASASTTRKTEPDVRGIQVAADHFVSRGVRVLVVLPQYFWKSTKFRPLAEEQLEILHDLKVRGLLVPSPPADDDDAYAITIAQREDAKSQRNPDRIKPGYVLSNDMFRDAQDRDETGNLRRWLQDGRHSDYGPGRISFTFFDNQSMNDRGEHVLDFQPNPRHPLVKRLLEHS